jgi:hypothetical protein
MARTSKEWAQHPQAAAIAALPLRKIEHTDPRKWAITLGERLGPRLSDFDDLRVLAGPTCAHTLAEHGCRTS